ncbi:Nodule Cysteine-Rich (NCR) secreted peptide [Medicago truncatula]|uniref:Nodule Cysteine-Rich (NCR) secreted peptide n=2 Tax=Medicago truncatula TaxID=3880 RepID=A0A072TXW5_MEDTR|nr:Nodule Cysteine-Rich (NCR) secreted peptide [Medicago truncatula]
MDETLKFVYLLIRFLSIFFLIIKSNSFYSHVPNPCITDKDCIRRAGMNIRCRKGYCVNLILR